MFFVLSVSLISNGSINVNLILNPKLLYYTPGLWERTGVPFGEVCYLKHPLYLEEVLYS